MPAYVTMAQQSSNVKHEFHKKKVIICFTMNYSWHRLIQSALVNAVFHQVPRNKKIPSNVTGADETTTQSLHLRKLEQARQATHFSAAVVFI